MAITQFSRIQHRRGTFTELTEMPGPLNTSELGHIIDQQRLFIGNGQLAEGSPVVGNTEIITDVTLLNNPGALKYTYQSNTGVIPQTGPSANTPIVRSIGQILDDYVSVKDFGAKGDGLTDDTAAINRALQQLYTIPVLADPTAGYRKLYFPAGKYIVSNYVFLPPNAALAGDGAGTIIFMSNIAATAVIRTADSLFQTGAQMGANSAALPSNIKVEDMTIQHGSDQVVARLERANSISFENVTFIGAWNSTLTGSNSAAIYLDSLGTSTAPSNIKFRRCAFMSTYYGLQLTNNAGAAHNIYFESCFFQNQNNSIFTTYTCQDIKIINSRFKSVYGTVITASPLSLNVSSTNNTFDSCGASGIPLIWFQNNVADYATNCSSINDQFINVIANSVNIQNDGAETVILNNSGPFILQNIAINPLLAPITLAGQNPSAPASTSFTMNLSEQNTAFIDYTLVRGSNVRIGRLFILSKNADLSQTVLTDLFSENNPTGIDFDYSISGSTLTVVYTDNQGNPSSSAVWNIQPKFWIS